jgi:hypothetical protein
VSHAASSSRHDVATITRGEFSTTALEIEYGRVEAIHVVRNPDKLKHLHVVRG